MSRKITDKLIYQAGMKRIPISGTFELTPTCNFSCKMCYVRKGTKEVDDEGGLKSVEQWLEWAKSAKESGMLYLLITGGEPLIYPGFWELYEQLTQMGFVITINSNGSLITENIARRFAEMPPKKINITLYGASNETYEQLCDIKNGYDRVMDAAKALQQNRVQYKYNCSLTPYNCHELKKMYELAKTQGVPIEIATYMFPSVRRNLMQDSENVRLSAEEAGYYSVENMWLQLNEEQFCAYAKQKIKFERPPENLKVENKGREMGCRAGRCSFWLDWQGNLSACGMIDTPKYSLEQEPFSKAWKHVVESTNQVLYGAGCSGCKNQNICHACISSAYCETGNEHGRPVYICKMLEAESNACKKKLLELGFM